MGICDLGAGDNLSTTPFFLLQPPPSTLSPTSRKMLLELDDDWTAPSMNGVKDSIHDYRMCSIFVERRDMLTLAMLPRSQDTFTLKLLNAWKDSRSPEGLHSDE